MGSGRRWLRFPAVRPGPRLSRQIRTRSRRPEERASPSSGGGMSWRSVGVSAGPTNTSTGSFLSGPGLTYIWLTYFRAAADARSRLPPYGRHAARLGLFWGLAHDKTEPKSSCFLWEECGDVGKHPGVAVSRLKLAPRPRLPFLAPQSGCFLRLFEEKHRRDLGRGYAPTEPFVRVTSADITTRLTSQQSSCRNGAAGFSCSADGKQGLPQGNVKRGMCGEKNLNQSIITTSD